MSLEPNETLSGDDWRAAFSAACSTLPAIVELPYAMTPEGGRMAAFRARCPKEFISKIDRAQLPNPKAFDALANWAGTYPGPLASGATGTAKTRAAWSAVGRLYVRENKPFAWFPVRRMITELERYETLNAADEFFRAYSHYRFLFVDDVDKINWAFESHGALLFAFYDWIYRANIPCITTTNKPRDWWAKTMGDAFARRLFDDAHHEVRF
jgi:DNA replication protein DnaC